MKQFRFIPALMAVAWMTAADVRLVSAQEVTVGDPQVEKIGGIATAIIVGATIGPTIVAGAITTGSSAWIDPTGRSAAIGRSGPSAATDRNDRRVPIARRAADRRRLCQRHHEFFCGSRCCCSP